MNDDKLVRALSSIFQQWNTTSDPCSGAAIDSSITIYDEAYNPLIKCDCSYEANSTCHITQLKVSKQDVDGVIPDELWTLNFLSYLNLGSNFLAGPLSASVGNLTSLQVLDLGHNYLTGPLSASIGNLANMEYLSLGHNGLSGELPKELMKLTNLTFFECRNNNLKEMNMAMTWCNLEVLSAKYFFCKSALDCDCGFRQQNGGKEASQSP